MTNRESKLFFNIKDVYYTPKIKWSMLNESKIDPNIIKDFPLLKNFTYLDSASTSLTPLPVINSINDYFVNYNSNISRGAYKIAIKANENVDESRENISKFLTSVIILLVLWFLC